MPTHVTLYYTTDPKIAGTKSVPIPVGTFASPTTAAGPDIKVLNFALALETLEARLYKEALYRLTTGGKDMFGNNITGLLLPASDPSVQYLTTFGTIEAQHQAFLEKQLGGNWALTAGALFDFGFGDTNNFGTPPLSQLQTIQLVYAAEQTGVSAYLGGAGPGGLTPGGQYLGVAASILGTEARHTAAVAILLNQLEKLSGPNAIATAPLVYPVVDKGTANGPGLDTALAPDAILNQGGIVAADTTVKKDGVINPISGPKGFVFLP